MDITVKCFVVYYFFLIASNKNFHGFNANIQIKLVKFSVNLGFLAWNAHSI